MYDLIEPGGLMNPEGRYMCIDTIGMDYESAVEATPRWYGVSFGNGNDGVSHMWPNFYVKTCEPWTLAAAAMLSDFKPGEGVAWCAENVQIDGEAEYGISATLYDPPDDREDYERDLEAAQESVTDARHAANEAADTGDDDDMMRAEKNLEEATDALETLEEQDPGYWSESNGAWMICEVFQVDEPNYRKPVYDSLREAFSADLIEMAREV